MKLVPRVSWWRLASLLLIFLSCARAQSLSSPISVVESKMSFDFEPNPRFVLPISNSTEKRFSANVKIELLDSENKEAAFGNLPMVFDPGNVLNSLIFGETGLPTKSPSELATYRLKYSVIPAESSAFAPIEGIVQMGKIMAHPYQIRTSSLDQVRSGTKYAVRARVENPFDGRPYPGMEVVAELHLRLADSGNEDRKPVVRTAQSDADGYAIFTFDLPPGHKYDGGNVTISVRRGVLLEQEDVPFKYPDESRLFLTTDKPIYQPGQTVHMRVQAFGPDKSALADAEVELAITDPENLNAFRTKIKTSRFGIAGADWDLPSNLRLGEFEIAASLSQGDWYESASAEARIKVSRYDLPDFSVEATPDLPYYLAKQQAHVKVLARYLFGEPLKDGHARITRLTNRNWNYRQQKYETEEQEVAKGEFGKDGTFSTGVSLDQDFEDFAEDTYEKYQDLEFAAYVTDGSTLHTEQRRFDLRLTHQAIHMYVSERTALVGSPAELYLMAYYADGSPAPVDVSIAAAKPNASGTFEEDQEHPLETVPLRTARTNSYGLVKITALEVPGECLVLDTRFQSQTAYLRFQAQDRKGAAGVEHSFVQFSQPRAFIELRPGKTLYRRGENMDVNIVSNIDEDKLIVEVIGESESLVSKVAPLTKGLGQVSFPYDPRFHGQLRILAYTMSTQREDLPVGSVHLLYPAKQDLHLALRLGKKSYKPGEQAVADFTITTAQGNPVQGALGTVVFDKAVSERVRTDRDFGGRGFGFMGYDWYQASPRTIAGFSLNDLLDWDSSRPFPEGLDLVAEALFHEGDSQSDDQLEIKGGENYFQAPASYFAKIIENTLQSAKAALDSSYTTTRKYPFSLDELRKTLRANGIDFDALRDPWGMPYEVVFAAGQNQDVLELKSGGPDKKPHTEDDFPVATFRRPNYLVAILDAVYRDTGEYPHNLAELKATLAGQGIDFDALRDPWGNPYKAVFSVSMQYDVMQIRSAGPHADKDTNDNFTVATTWRPYFEKIGRAIDRVRQNYLTETGRYIRDYEPLRDQLRKENIDLDALRDPWGHKYRFAFSVNRNYFGIWITSAGPDGVFSTKDTPSSDDVFLWNSQIQYFQRESASIDAALAEHFHRAGSFPSTAEQFRPVLGAAKLSSEELKDPWGQPYYFTFNEGSYYANSVRIKTYSVYPDRPRRTTTVVPVTQHVGYIHVMSDGPDPQYKAPFSVADFSGVLTEQSSKDLAPLAAADKTALLSGTGGIHGQVTDSSGATVMAVEVKAQGAEGKPFYQATTGPDGTYVLRNMQTGLYELHFAKPGFMESVVARVPVAGGAMTNLDVTLNIAEKREVVTVTANPATVQSSMASVSCQTCSTVTVEAQRETRPRPAQQGPTFTPRLRQYFPETLLWSPETVTDEHGHTRLRFRLGDNITTWTMSVLGSTRGGLTGVVQKDIPAFQPFFVEHDPPKFLTQGDVISLPVILRNYLGDAQSVSVEMKPDTWFSLLASPSQKVTLPAGGTANAVFALRADSSTKAGKQRVVASNNKMGDAVERTVAVHPNGEEIARTSFGLLGSDRPTMEFEVSDHAIKGSIEATVKLYPNLMAHVVEGVNAMVRQPLGCAEQSASSTLADLRVLQILRKVGQDDPKTPGNPNAEVARRAHQYLEEGYQKLLSYREADGGFSYWGKGGSDLAVTGHVLRVLTDARTFIDVDEKVIKDIRDFIVKQQQANGSWLQKRWMDDKPKPDATLTAYLARVLASTADRSNTQPDANVALALHYVEERLDEWKDSYLVANYALAAMASGRDEFQEKARQQLLSIAHDEGSLTYWNVEVNSTPFYGWGYGGRLETTALAVEALSLLPSASDRNGESAKQIRRGLLFLLQGKDRYGLWSSTAATVNVIDALIAAMPPGPIPGGPSLATIWLNGTEASSVRIPAPSEVTGPLVVALPSSIHNGRNTVEVRRPQDNSPLMTQVVSLEYLPWEYSTGTETKNLKRGESRALELTVHFSPSQAKVGDTVRCTVKVERIGFQGYGMMLAEIGLPPGVDVDRNSLEMALEKQGYAVGHYDVLPDRILFYVWPSAGGTEFSFAFRPRFRMDAESAPSLLYDYYNPEARSVVTPVRFVVH